MWRKCSASARACPADPLQSGSKCSYNWPVIVAVASFGQFVVAVVIDAAAAMLVFRHADKHGSRHATAWGLFTFLAAIVAIPAYVASYLLRTRRRG